MRVVAAAEGVEEEGAVEEEVVEEAGVVVVVVEEADKRMFIFYCTFKLLCMYSSLLSVVTYLVLTTYVYTFNFWILPPQLLPT